MDKGLTDIGLLLEPIDIEKYDYFRLNVKEKMVVVMRPDSPLASQDAVTVRDLSKLPIIIVRRPSAHNEIAHWFGKYYEIFIYYSQVI